MKQKKTSSNWYIAATHYLTAGFVIPLVVGMVYGALILSGIIQISSEIINLSISGIIQLVALWFGTMYSARYIAKTYVINNAGSIVNISSFYAIFFAAVSILFLFLRMTVDIIAGVTAFFAMARVLVLYLGSKKFVESNSFSASMDSGQQFTTPSQTPEK